MFKFDKTLIGRDAHLKSIQQGLDKVAINTGSIIAIEGESGTGKSYFLNFLLNELRQTDEFISLLVEVEAPIGKFNISNLQPLKPFSVAVDSLLEGNYRTAKDRFKKRLGMSILASLPLTGDIFYAVKEISKDWKDYKKEKSKEKSDDEKNAIDQFYDTICSFANKSPIVLMFNNFQWADASSIELLRRINESIHEIPILIIYSYRKSDLKSIKTPLYSYHLLEKNYHTTIKLENFKNSEVESLLSTEIENYKQDDVFLNWVIEKTFGNPGLIHEFVKFFKKNKPFNAKGKLVLDLNDVNLPITASGALSKSLENLTNEDLYLLSVCSAEGKEFSAYLIAKLLNTDVLTVIKRLREISNKTDIIATIGAFLRYGIKTTVYQFTQAFYYEYFADSLEYEEKVSLHGQISKELKDLYHNSDDDIKEQIVPYLVAHSREAEDDETADEMMKVAADFAKSHFNDEDLTSSFGEFLAPNKLADNQETSIESEMKGLGIESNGAGSSSQNQNDFFAIRNSLVEMINERKYELAISDANNFLTENADLSILEQIQLYSIISRIYMQIKDYNSAQSMINKARKIIELENDPSSECFILNSLALLYSEQGNDIDALKELRRAALLSLSLPDELKLLTLSNISKVLENIEPEQSIVYRNVALGLAKNLRFTSFEEFLNN